MKYRNSRRSRLRASLRASVLEGVWAEIVGACSGTIVLTGWALHFGAGPLFLGLLAAVPYAGYLAHLPAGLLTTRFGARRTAVVAVALSRQLVLVLAALPLVPLGDEDKRALVLACAAASAVLGVVGNNAWTAWMAELVPAQLRGRYFGRRTAICTGFGTATGLLVGAGLDLARATSLAATTLSALALVSACCGAVTTYLMMQQHAPPGAAALAPSVTAVLAPWRDRLARRYMRYQVCWNLAVGMGGSFFTAHLLTHLHLGFTVLALHAAGAALVRVAFSSAWGGLVDLVGARRVLVGCSLGMTVMPMLWVLAGHVSLWLLALDALVSGLCWSGHGIAAFSLPLALSPRAARPFYHGAFALTGGLAYAGATLLAGKAVAALPASTLLAGAALSPFELLFVGSALGRGLSALLASRIIEPPRQGVVRVGPTRVEARGRAA